MLRKSAMYNLKVSTALATGGGSGGGPGGGSGAALLAVDPQGVTPRTPEILNSLMAMSHPLESYPSDPNSSAAVPDLHSPSGAAGAAGSPCRPCRPCGSPPSVQHTRSQLIKEGLKLTLQTKRRHTSGTSGASGASGASGDEDDESPTSGKRVNEEELTPEDEERRRRRRERNKVAATKCRIKKRERTVNLVQESEILENQNYELKSQIQELETQRRRLVDMLSTHSPSCTRPGQVSQPAPPAYDMFSAAYCCPSPGAAQPQTPAAGAYDDVLHQYCHGGGAEPGRSPLEPLPPFYAVTKHEVVDDPLLSGLEDHLIAPYGPYSMAEDAYCRPTSTPGTPGTPGTPASTPSSLDSPAALGGSLGGLVIPGPSHHYHQQPPGDHLGGSLGGNLGVPLGGSESGLTPLPLSPEGMFGMDSGCMA